MIELPWWAYALTVLLVTHFTIISVTIYLHRHQAHRSISLNPFISHILRFWLWLTTGIVTREWVAVHRKHHAKVETPNDPHSPQVVGIQRVLFGGFFLYRRETKQKETLKEYGSGTPNDWLERNLYTRFRDFGILLMLLVDVLIFGVIPGLLIWAIQMLWIPMWAAGVINGLGHWYGYRNYELPDASHNLTPWGIFIGGEELHNNHHAFASSAKFSARRFEIDLGWIYICLLQSLHLAKVCKTPPTVVRQNYKTRCDEETLRAVITNRFDITSRFTREVFRKVCHEETKRDGKLRSSQRAILQQAIKLVQQESRGLNTTARRHLQTALALSPRVATTYGAKIRLQEIWCRSTNNRDSLLQQLEDWCIHAENSGIEALREFARQLRSYQLIEN
uniref:Fatty-acid desaturase n=1 Tax=uncultured gamma proteobacterium HF0200_24F15 TaxID=723570 RepID=E7C3Y3_9GAMM|nr:fatty-acid desaturase [uncultured gamma proteobacterium HF0200_24F15]